MIFLYPYKKGLVWAVFHDGHDHEFKTLGAAEEFARSVNIVYLQIKKDLI